MRILITGGAGFIGSHLTKRFLSEGHEVICMDNLSTGTMENLKGLPEGNFTFICHDVTEYLRVEGDLEYILHFASPASPMDYLRLPIQTLKVGSLGTHKTLGLARAKKSKFLLASTSEVYGDPLIHPQHEDYWGNVNPIGPRGVYDEAKRFAEALVMAYHRAHGLDTRIVRIFNTYGPNMRRDDGRAVPTFIQQALSGKDITVFGNGNQTRSFTYITDLVEGIVRLMEASVNNPVNLGNPEEMTILEMAKLILEISGSTSQIVFQELPRDDPKVREPDISRAREVLGWEPQVSTREGIVKTFEWFRSKG